MMAIIKIFSKLVAVPIYCGLINRKNPNIKARIGATIKKKNRKMCFTSYDISSYNKGPRTINKGIAIKVEIPKK